MKPLLAWQLVVASDGFGSIEHHEITGGSPLETGYSVFTDSSALVPTTLTTSEIYQSKRS